MATTDFPRTGGARRTRGKRPGWYRWRWFALPIVLVLAALALFWWLGGRTTTTTTTTTGTVSKGNLTISVSGSGTVAAARTVDVPFQQSGTITAVNVKVGDTVKAGQTLATIDDTNLKLQLQQAQANLTSAQAAQSQTQTGTTTTEDLTSAKAALDSAKAQLQQTRTGTATAADIRSAEAQLASAKAQLSALQNPDQTKIVAAQAKVDQAQLALQSTRDSASQAKTNAELALQNAANALVQAQSQYGIAKQNWDHVQAENTDPSQPTTTNSQGQKVPNKLNNTQRQQYYNTFVQAEASMHNAENNVTQAQVAYDQARQNEVLQIQQAEATVKSAQDDVSALMNPTASDVTQAQAAVTQAQANLDKLRQGGTAAAITQSQAAVTQAQANLDKLNAPPTDSELASAGASVVQAQVAVDTAQRNLEQASVLAPFDGVVAAVSASEGALSSVSGAAFTIVDRSTLHIDVSLSESDVAKVQVGQPVTLTFDALPDVTLIGKVATVSPVATAEQNVVTYPVQIEFDPGNSGVKVGMSATADIQTQQIEGATLVPSRAVQTSGSTKSITVLQGDQKIPVTVEVETGVTSNGQTEITSCVATSSQCLNAGDVVSITSTSSGTSSGTSTNSNRNTLIPGGGSLSGPPR